MHITCPYCGAETVEMTTHDDNLRNFLCLGRDHHRFTEEFEGRPAETKLIILP